MTDQWLPTGATRYRRRGLFGRLHEQREMRLGSLLGYIRFRWEWADVAPLPLRPRHYNCRCTIRPGADSQ